MSEQIHFKLGLASTFWDKKPEWRVSINGEVKEFGVGTGFDNSVLYVEFDHEFEDGDNTLEVSFLNKNDSDTVQNEDKSAIVKDLMLHIRSLEIDEVDVGELLWSNSTFTGQDTSRPVLERCVDMGWNGTWTFPFSTPFYLWFLERM